jgi:hypothetical protein
MEKQKETVSNGKARYFSESVKRMIYCSANAKCQNPACGRHLNYIYDCAEFAHIWGREPGSARYNNGKKDAFVGSFNNGLLLCCNCHTIIDKNPKDFTTKKLVGWKTGKGDKGDKGLISAIGYAIITVGASAIDKKANKSANSKKH